MIFRPNRLRVFLTILLAFAASPSLAEVEPGAKACFFTEKNYAGQSFCYGQGRLNRIHPHFRQTIRSVRLDKGLTTALCKGQGLTGQCRELTKSRADFGAESLQTLSIEISALPKVASASPAKTVQKPKPAPSRSRLLGLPESYTLSVTTGAIGTKSGHVWYQVDWNQRHSLTMQNGASWAVSTNGKTSGCKRAAFQGRPLMLSELKKGTMLCILTAKNQVRALGYMGRSASKVALRLY